MKAVDYIASVMRRENGKTHEEARRLAEKIAQVKVHAIKEGPEVVSSK